MHLIRQHKTITIKMIALIATTTMISVVSGVFLRSSLTLKSLWVVPFVDLFSFFIWGASLWGNTVRWGEHIFRVQRDGKMIRVGELPAV